MIRRIWQNSSIWAVIAQIVVSATTFIIAPIVSEKIGIEAYGYVSLAQNILMYIGTIAIAFNYFAERNVSVAFHKGCYREANSYFSSTLVADAVLFLVIFVPSVFIITDIQEFLNISSELEADVKLLFFFMLLNYFVSLFATTYEAAGVTRNRIDVNSKSKVASSLVQFVTLIIIFQISRPHIWYVGLCYLLSSAIYLIFQLNIKNQVLPELHFERKLVSLYRIVSQVKNGIWVSFNNLGNILNDGLDLLITNLMISEHTMGVISIAKLFGNFSYAVVVAISNSLRASQIKAYSEENTDELVRNLKIAMKITGSVFCLIFGGFIGCGEIFLKLWLGRKGGGEIYIYSLLSLSANIITCAVAPLYYTYTLYSKVKLPCFITIGMGLINTISMYILIKYTSLGGVAVLLTTTILNLIHLLDAPIYASFCMGIKKITFYGVLGKYLFCTILFAGAAVLMKTHLTQIFELPIVVIVLLYLMVGLFFVYTIMLEKNEKKILFCKIIRKSWDN